MRIALFTDGIQPYVIGGMQKHSYFVAKYLARNGVHVDLYHYQQQKEHDIQALDVFSPEEKRFIHSIVLEFPPPGKLPGHYLRESLEYSRRIYAAYRDRPPVDFIYAKGYCAWHLLKQKRKGEAFPPVAVKFHGMNMFQRPPSFRGQLENLMLRPPTRFNLRHADYVFSYGGKITDITVNSGVPREKVLELPTGIDADWLVETAKMPGKVRRFLFVGRYERLKGIEELSESIRKSTQDFEFHFVGPIPEELRMKSEKVKYWGKITEKTKMQQVVRDCDVVVCPSYSEGMPNVILEGMASGLAVVATDVGAIAAVVRADNGWLLESCTVARIDAALAAVLAASDAELHAKKQASLRIAREELTWDKIGLRLVEMLRRLTGKAES